MAHNAYLKKLAEVDSVETLLLNTPRDGAVVEKIRNAEALFLAGGDQWNYVRMWRGAPAGEAIQFLLDKGVVPVGGTSAGLAVLGDGATAYDLHVDRGVIRSTQEGGSVY